MLALSKKDIEKLFAALNQELQRMQVVGELYLVGGAVMCLVFEARPSTRDLDAFFRPTSQIRTAAANVALQMGIEESWLNDSVKGFLSDTGEFNSYLELQNLRIFVAKAEYLFAMKCMAMRIGEEFRDLDDIRYLIRHLDIRSYQQALILIEQYYPPTRIPQKTLYALEEILQAN